MSLAPAARLVLVDLPGAAARWWLAPWPPLPATRDEALQAGVAACGALLVLYAGWAHTAHRATPGQVRGLATAGFGFLMTAGASAALREHAALGPAVSLAGALLVLRASLALVRERQAARDADVRAAEARRAADAARRGVGPGAE